MGFPLTIYSLTGYPLTGFPLVFFDYSKLSCEFSTFWLLEYPKMDFPYFLYLFLELGTPSFKIYSKDYNYFHLKTIITTLLYSFVTINFVTTNFGGTIIIKNILAVKDFHHQKRRKEHKKMQGTIYSAPHINLEIIIT